MPPAPILAVEDVTKVYGSGERRVDALGGVSFKVDKGEFVAIMGPSGSGKSTLLHLIGGLDSPTAGHVRLDGTAMDAMSDGARSVLRRRKIGFIFQFFHLLPTLSVIENACLPMLLDGRSLGDVMPKAKELLEYMRLGKRLDHRPDQLSGGEMQRVAIARALVAEPSLVLADEPTGNLDSRTGESILELLTQLVSERGQTIVMVTHDPKSTRHSKRLIALRDGKVEFDGPPADMPASMTASTASAASTAPAPHA
jgi:putative ABC transport system ATP-binding protein